MKKRWMALGILLAGCSVAPTASTPNTATGQVSVGLGGAGYAVQSILAQPSWTFSAIAFQPTKVELHYAGVPGAEVPADLVNQVVDQSTANVSDEQDSDPTAEDGQWITLPLAEGLSMDLTKLSSAATWLGSGALKVGKYDKIRLTGSGSYEASDGTNPQNGSYFLPSGRLYLNQGFEIRENTKTNLTFAFDASQAMVQAGTKVILKPTSVKVSADYEPVAAASPTPSPEN